ncbi:hypothetical protein LOK46_07805 [Methylobacterium sp. NMS14P]|uniref:P-loop ATPase, Sll1717 family n=1 Tax=Methylobacterium sp. NMS14P TaxID=2894310 RepID=UPI00235A1A8A|nr:hypothetical protein [Methylobacterium sp. NMS14P]WCS26719.1 hypothetical protein LOK46_07805 [Methylobacterium sp. NMS14P]
MDRLTLLKSLSFGSQVAEEEIQDLGKYFVQTDQWNRIIKGEIDIIRGEKGAGKSAIYLLLNQNINELFDKRVLLVNAENPKGSTVFKDLVSDPPASEAEFILLWKLYILVLIVSQMREYGLSGKNMGAVLLALEEAQLIETELNLSGLLRTAQILARRLLSKSRIETGVELEPVSGMPAGIIGRISLAEPDRKLRERGVNSLDGYLRIVNDVLAENKISVWVLLDRLDVAFAENHTLEANAIRALLRVYGDLRSLDNIALKIFLREDIWKRITENFREASHLIRYEIVEWTQPTLLNLILRRVLNNETLVSELNLDPVAILADVNKQNDLFELIFPPQVEQGTQKSPTFKWMVTRCADGKGKTAPRELIHLLKSIKDQEVRRMERGGGLPPSGQLFDRSVFKAALPAVSDARLKTYIFAEYMSEKPFIERLYRQKTEHTPESLGALWGVNRDTAIRKADQLVELGFFERRGTNQEPTFWIPFLYRDALNSVQGKADADD